MHYKRKRTAKEKSTSFYLKESLLEKIDLIADLEGQSRSIIVEMCIEFYLKGKWDDESEFFKFKRKFYKKPKSSGYKKKKKIRFSQENEQSLF